MEQNDKAEKPLHKIRSRCTSLAGATEMFKTYPAEKKPKMILFMKEAAQDIMDCLTRLEKDLQ